ncbi:MAG TPA: sulfatase-like hydrolase/transferase [Bryobacteraceae bacterium]|nr:sulfatase-like hydrolase/transferase [Bryobacteraceae bacterium]
MLPSRRTFLATSGVALAQQQPPAVTTARRPNILWIMTDQHRFDCLGANGNSRIRTPNLDRLAARSANFQNAFVQAPVCVPSRASYFTGRYPHSHKNRVNYTPLDSREMLAQQIFRAAGYQTGAVGKLHYYPPTLEHARSLGWDRIQLDDGVPATDRYSDFITWRSLLDPDAPIPHNATAPLPGKNPFRSPINYGYTPTAWTGNETRRMLHEFAVSPKPFFLFSSFFKPHAPYAVPAPFDAMYDGVEIPLPRQFTLDDIRKLPLPVQKQILRGEPQHAMDRSVLQWIYRSYYAGVSMVDREIGFFLDDLERLGKAQDTIVIFSTDHGDQLLEHGLFGKNVFFESSVHVPFLLSFPGRMAPGKREEIVEMVDLLPTLLEYCGLPARTSIQGRSLVKPQPREFAFAENIIPEVITSGTLEMPYAPGQGVAGVRHPDAKMIRTARWKLNYYPGNGGELYDLKNDPAEERNLYTDPAQQTIVRGLKDQLLDFLITADETDQIAPRWLVGDKR